ncbi:HD domain-containing protein [Jiangella sp. DSM 45060]|uniref:HD domain-containing protein n=1 Tax=Jiangella sp. DSM 45060 TaxID=1798224 RepID=UPI0008799AEE|nr:HD domain-containing protein [Jiangella sp. DSM 45060]SDT63399.1 HDIG domain-containing protein [Jiangella sp. DSM 45060]
MPIIDDARWLAHQLLADEWPKRWRHVVAVAERAESLTASLEDRQALVCAAWLHDIGYATAVSDTGFHPLDGARHLRRIGFDPRVTALVAHHSCAEIEAELRGLGAELRNEFPRERTIVADALCTCDFTTGPDGEPLSVAERLDEIRTRYGTGHVVTRFSEIAEGDIRAAVARATPHLGAVLAAAEQATCIQPMYGRSRPSR